MGKSGLSSPCSNGLPGFFIPGSSVLRGTLHWEETEAHREP